ncbi:MAG: chaperone modulator CbpM [Dermatophilaceae bacterium]
MTYFLATPHRLDLAAFARAAQLHPDMVRRLVALGLLEVSLDTSGGLWFEPSQLAAVARIQRLRAGFSLNYAALGLVIELLDRIAELEAMTRTRPRHPGGPTWT